MKKVEVISARQFLKSISAFDLIKTAGVKGTVISAVNLKGAIKIVFNPYNPHNKQDDNELVVNKNAAFIRLKIHPGVRLIAFALNGDMYAIYKRKI
jgi:hypothetical protein